MEWGARLPELLGNARRSEGGDTCRLPPARNLAFWRPNVCSFLKTALRTRDGSFRPLALLPFFCEIGLLRFRSGQQLPMPKGRTRKNSKLKNETTSLRRTDRWSVNLSTTQFLLPGLPALISVCRTLRGFVGFLKLAHKAPRGRSWSYRYGRSYRSVKK